MARLPGRHVDTVLRWQRLYVWKHFPCDQKLPKPQPEGAFQARSRLPHGDSLREFASLGRYSHWLWMDLVDRNQPKPDSAALGCEYLNHLIRVSFFDFSFENINVWSFRFYVVGWA